MNDTYFKNVKNDTYFRKGDTVSFCEIEGVVLADSDPEDTKVSVLCEGFRQNWYKVFEGSYVRIVKEA